jgi:hypothetical protein
VTNRQQSLEAARSAAHFLSLYIESQIVDDRLRAEIRCLLAEFERIGEKECERQANREHWLNGWHRRGDSVLIGTGTHCAGCGKFLGVTCVIFDGSPLPEKPPDFPFEEATCPLCACRRSPGPVDKLTERLERLREKDKEAK